MIEHLATPNDKIIVELTRHEIEFIASAAHLFLFHHPDNSTVKQLISNLMQQTNLVSAFPEKHGINIEIRAAGLTTTQEQWGKLSSSMDLSRLSPLLYTE